MKDDEISLVTQKLKWLRLPGMAEQLKGIVEKAAKDNLSVLRAVDRFCDEEKASRLRNVVDRRIRDARFPEVNTIDAFDFDFCPVRKKARARYLALHDLAFIDKSINPLFIGTPGTGKTFLARALAFRACQANRRVVLVSAPRMLNDLHGGELHGRLDRSLRKYVRADLLVIDGFATLEMDPSQAKLAYQAISERYDHRRSTAITTNRPFKELDEGLPRRAQRAGDRRAAHRAVRALRDGWEGVPRARADLTDTVLTGRAAAHPAAAERGPITPPRGARSGLVRLGSTGRSPGPR